MGRYTQLAESKTNMELNPDSAASSEGPAEKVLKVGGDPRQILVVDDESPIRMLLQKILEANGYICRTAENTSDARGLLEERTSDLIPCSAA